MLSEQLMKSVIYQVVLYQNLWIKHNNWTTFLYRGDSFHTILCVGNWFIVDNHWKVAKCEFDFFNKNVNFIYENPGRVQ
jgi:hypothetical protein